MACVSRSKLFGPTRRSIRMVKQGIIAQDGPRTLASVDLCDFDLPFEVYDRAVINLDPDAKDFPLEITGFGDNYGFLLIRPRYDLDNRLEANQVLKWKTDPESDEYYPISDLMVLSGSSAMRWPIIYLTNDTQYPAEIEVFAAKPDNEMDFFKIQQDEDVNNEDFVIEMLAFDDIKSMADDLNLYVYPSGEETPLAYTTVENIVNLDLEGNQLIIDDVAYGELILRFIDKFNAQQAYCGITYWMNDPLNRVLPQPVDTGAPVINWNPLRSGPIDMSDVNTRQAAIFLENEPFDPSNTVDKQGLLEYFIYDITDDRDGDIPFDPYLVSLTKAGKEVEAINSLGSYDLHYNISDCAGNEVCSSITISVRPGDQYIDPDVYTLDFDVSFDENYATFTPVLSNPYVTGSYSWDFGDGATSTDEIPTHIYNTQSVFTVTVIFDPADDSLTNRTVIKNVIVPAPSYSFTWDHTLFITPTEKKVEFVLDPSGLPTGSYDWDFDDGNQLLGSNDATVEHVYATDGAYNPLTIYNPDNQNLPVQYTEPISVGLPTYSIWFNSEISYDSLGKYLLSVDVQTDDPSVAGNYEWDFGPSFPPQSGNTTSVDLPSSLSGPYPIEFTHTSTVDPLVWTQVQDIELLVINWDFVMNGRDITLTPTNSSSTTGTGYEYSWGDLFVDTNPVLAPQTHSYATSGEKEVEMKFISSSIPNPLESVTYKRQKSVYPFQISFSHNVVGASTQVEFDKVTDLPSTVEAGVYTWNFGPYGTQTGDSALVTFPSPGTYTVILTYNSFDGRYNDTYTQDITI